MLTGVPGVDLAADQVDRLARRTEGWPAGVALAAASLAGRDGDVGAGASAGCVDQHTVRASRARLLRAVFTRMRMSHVLNVDRPSKRSTLRITATQVSWTTSSAASALPRIERATRNITGVCRRTSSR